MKLEDIIEKGLTFKEIEEYAKENHTEPIQLKLAKQYEYIRLNFDNREIYFHKRRSDGMYYYIEFGWQK